MAVILGREHELAAVGRFLTEARAHYSVLLLEGEAGIGKTSVWTEAVRLADVEGFRVLSCRAVEAEAKLAFASLTDLLRPVGEEVLGKLPEPQRLALDVALLRANPRGPPVERRAIATALLSVLTILTHASPLVVAVDDAQWLDRASHSAFSFALRRLTPERALGLLVSVRVGTGHQTDVLGLAQLKAARLDRVRLGPLNLRALHRVIGAELGLALPRPTMERIAQETGGNPLFALELARSLADGRERPGPGSRLPVPSGLSELLRARVAKLPPSARQALLVSALVSHPTTTLVERALGPSAEEALHQAWHGGLIEIRDRQIHFVHPLYAAAVAASALPQQRRACHQRLTEIVEDREEQARHVALATTGTDERVAARLEEAATLARSRGAWSAAGELLERARELTPTAGRDEASRRAIAAAEHHVHAGDRARARSLVEEVLTASPPPQLRADALRLLGEISLEDENATEAGRLLTEALAHADDARLAARIELGLVYVCANLLDWPAAGAHAYHALEHAKTIGDRTLAGTALGHCAMMDFLCGKGVDWAKLEVSLDVVDAADLVPLQGRPTTIAALLLLYLGEHDEARRRLRALSTAASDSGDESDLAFILLWLSWLETRSGDFTTAVTLAEEAASLATLTGSRSMHAWTLTQQAFVHAHRGAVNEARRCCAEASAPVGRSGDLLPVLWMAASLTHLELSLGDAAAAWQACEPLIQALEEHGIAEPVTAVFLPDALEALVALDHLDRAERVLAAFHRRAVELDRPWALATAGRLRGLLLAATGDLTGALAALDQALRQHERIGMSFERARTLVVKGIVERRSGRRTSAKASLQEAVGEFTRMGARVWAERAAAELRRIPIRRGTGKNRLTPTEETVAELVARGQTNRQVARALSISEKTVEAHLTRIYRKFGVSSRAGLTGEIVAGNEPRVGDTSSES
jgi:DNA-binding CsgD family transcriptional regulator